jgi:methyl coenzyme M reductase beta subunit
VTLVWAVPVVAAALATLVVVARARAVEDECGVLAREVAALAELRHPLAAVRDATAETDELAAAFRERHAVDGAPLAASNGSHGGD